MSIAFGFVVGILQAILSLIGFVQTNPSLPQAQHDQVVQIAQQAISQATQALATSQSSQATQSFSSVSGMSQYTDTDFGFSFWYPSGWIVKNVPVASPNDYPGSTVTKNLLVQNQDGTVSLEIYEIASGDPAVIFRTSHGLMKHYFDVSSHLWMTAVSVGFNASAAQWNPSVADISNNTMGGLHILKGPSDYAPAIVPLSGHHFLLVSGSSNASAQSLAFVRSILATDPAVATPVSATQQRATIEAEAAAYGITTTPSNLSTNPSLSTYASSQYGISFQYPASAALQIGNTGVVWGGFGSVSAADIVSLKSGPETFMVSVSPDPTDVGNCMVLPGSNERSVSKNSVAVIGGVSFLTYEQADAAMGHYTGDKIYHVIHNNACYQLLKRTESGRTESQQDADAQQASIDAASRVIDPIIQSFKFNIDASGVQPPTCALSNDKFTYKLGDVITLSWQSTGATRALWDQGVDSNTSVRKVIVPPAGTPATSGTASTVANIEGYVPIKMQVVGPGGFGKCSTDVSVSHSAALPSITVDGVSFTPSSNLNSSMSNAVTISGTATNGALYNQKINLVLIDAMYAGPFDEASIYKSGFARDGKGGVFYSGGAYAPLTDDSQVFERWDAESFVPVGVTRVRVLAYPFTSSVNSSTQPLVNKILTIGQ